MFDRLIKLIGQENFNLIQSKKVLLVGVGGVGSYSFEALVRNGFKYIDVIDHDNIDVTNLNRQLITNQGNVGNPKVNEAVLRAKSINPDICVNGYQMFLDESNIEEILNNNYDYVIDACDSINTKFLLIEKTLKFDYKLISSMGTAKRVDASKVIITTLDKTSGDPLARILRKKVKDAHINKKIHVVTSTENYIDVPCLGSTNLVPSVAGLMCVSYVVNDLINGK